MIETISDLISLVVLIGIIVILCSILYKVLLAHHIIKLDRLEQDYYDDNDDDNYITKEE